jgi:hypothetical protein
MYQIQEITINRNSSEAMKFYTETVLPYISLISTESEKNERENTISRVNAEIKTNLTADKIMIHIEEDWTGVFVGCKGVYEMNEWKFHEICREFINHMEELKDVCDYRYERRSLINRKDDSYDRNYVEIYEPLKMENPIYAHGTFFNLNHLPVNNFIKPEQLPERVWYPASPTIIIQWLDGYIDDPDYDFENTDWKTVTDPTAGLIPVSEEYVGAMERTSEAEQKFLDYGGIYRGDNEVETTDERVFTTSEFRFQKTAYSYSSSEISELMDNLTKFYKAATENNHNVFKAADKEEHNLITFQMLFYSDKFDALEIYLDEETLEFKWAYYENGVTEIVEVPETELYSRGYSSSSPIF